MATIKEIIEYSKANPNTDYAKKAYEHITSGAFDEQAAREGVDLSFAGRPPLKSKNTGLESAPFQATGQEGVIKGTLKAVANAPKSAIETGKSIVTAVTNPKQTLGAITNLAKGTGQKITNTVLENTDFGQEILRKAKERGYQIGGQEIQQGEDGKLKAIETPETEMIAQVGQLFKDRYGSIDKFKETMIEDPVGSLADIATVLSGGGAVATKLGQVSKIGALEKSGTIASKVGSTVEPITATTKTAGGIVSGIKNTGVGKVVADILPSSSKLQQSQVTKALELTAGDLSSIKQKTGNDVSDFIVRNKAIKDTPEETSQAIEEIRTNTKSQVRNEIAKVKNVYPSKDIPVVKQGLNVILKSVQDVPGLEDVAAEIKKLSTKTDYNLEDIQRAKELIDDNSSIYSKMGTVESTSQAKGLDNIRRQMKEFIEKEVDTATGGQTNIRQLNNDVSTSYAIQEAIDKRAMKGIPRSSLNVFEGILGLGAYSQYGFTAAASIILAKKIAESPTFRLKIAQGLSKLDKVTKGKISKEIAKKSLSPESKQIIKSILDDVNKSRQYIESGANVLDEVTEDEEIGKE